jgi:hypothetical protein
VAVTAAQLKDRFPGLKGDGSAAWDATLTAVIAAAERETPADIWGDLQDEGVLHLAAHKLAGPNPHGVNAKLASTFGSSTYLKERERLEVIVAAGPRVA